MYVLYNTFYKQIELVMTNDTDAELLLAQRKDSYLGKRITDKHQQKDISKEAEANDKLDTYERVGNLIILDDDYECISCAIDQMIMDVGQNFNIFIKNILPNIRLSDNESTLVNKALKVIFEKYRISYNGDYDDYDNLDSNTCYGIFNTFMLYNEYYERNIK